MERVAFLLEQTGERLGCLLNPESLTLRRSAGLHTRRSIGGQFTGTNLRDDPLMYSGGGRTEIDLHLLFDVALAGSTIETEDVRDLTSPLWELAENSQRVNSYLQPPLVRFVWGKSWNIPAVVVSVAEHLEQFALSGAPRRCWLSLRLWRVNEPQTNTELRTPGESALNPELLNVVPETPTVETVQAHTVSAGERLDEIAARYYPDQPGGSALWRLLASFNNIEDPLHVPPGTVIRIPPLSLLGGAI